jgi:hypothetical protein
MDSAVMVEMGIASSQRVKRSMQVKRYELTFEGLTISMCTCRKIWRRESRSLREVHRCDVKLCSDDIVDGIWSIVVHRAWCWAKHIVEWSGIVLPWCQHGKGCGTAKFLGNIRSRFNAGNVAGDMVVGGVYRMISQFHGGSGVARVYEVGGTIWAQKARTL